MSTATEKLVSAAKPSAPKPRAPRQAKVPAGSTARPAMGPRMKSGEFEAAPKPKPATPEPTQPVPGETPAKGGAAVRAKGGKAFASKLNVSGRVLRGIQSNAHPAGTGPIVPIMAVVFIIVAVAKVRGAANINTKRAVFGGFLATFLLMALYKLNPALGTAFAALVLVQVLLDYGLVALQGLTQSGGYTSTPLGGTTAYTSYGTAYSTNGLAPLSPNARPGMNIETGAPQLISLPGGQQVQVPAGTNINQWLSSHGYPTSSIFD